MFLILFSMDGIEIDLPDLVSHCILHFHEMRNLCILLLVV